MSTISWIRIIIARMAWHPGRGAKAATSASRSAPICNLRRRPSLHHSITPSLHLSITSHASMFSTFPRVCAAAVFLGFASILHAVSVRQFGAKGDGVADDTDAIKSAVRAASDGVVEFPRGQYRV